MSEARDPDHALPAPYLLYKGQSCDNENRPLDELWNERFREEFNKWVHLQSEPEKTEWVYQATHLKTATSTNKVYNHPLGKAGTKKQSRPMSLACICAALCNTRWSEESIKNGSKGNGWAARAAAAYPNANIWRGRPSEEQDDAAITSQPDNNDDAEEPMVTERPTQTAGGNARYERQSKTKRRKAQARTIKQHLRALMGKKTKKVGVAKRQSKIAAKSPRSDGEIKKLKQAVRRSNRTIQQDEETIRLLKSELHEEKEYDKGYDGRCRSTTLSPSRSATLSPGPASSPTLSTGPGTLVDNLAC
ncbi:uncharacterized protein FTJAE_13802 [Fusarium tjaetaba]|uniref:Uncharacterized protein n=1 Tax=Fusarium tjaetaba TaxID=1567544 RepID=A0A8H5QHT0_9HYPO|nr:uncharacterized protein FTJAE_13802 [Fusarium tjaetaba]KAF5614046.1 hypothetical protein FTJAE_13802 [Fusarium tjaetaba]